MDDGTAAATEHQLIAHNPPNRAGHLHCCCHCRSVAVWLLGDTRFFNQLCDAGADAAFALYITQRQTFLLPAPAWVSSAHQGGLGRTCLQLGAFHAGALQVPFEKDPGTGSAGEMLDPTSSRDPTVRQDYSVLSHQALLDLTYSTCHCTKVPIPRGYTSTPIINFLPAPPQARHGQAWLPMLRW